MFDVAGNLDALGGELCGLAHGGGDDVDALGQTLDHALGNGEGVLRGRGHATKEHMVPGVVVKRRDLEPCRQRGTKLCQCLGQTQENQAVDGNEAELFACIAADGLVQATNARGTAIGQGDNLAGKAASRQLVGKGLGTLATHGAVVARLGEQAQALAARSSQGVYQAGDQLTVVRCHQIDTAVGNIAVEQHNGQAPRCRDDRLVIASAGVDDQTVHASIDKSGERLGLLSGVVAANGRHERAAARGGAGGKALEHSAGERVGDVGQDHADEVGARAAQIARGSTWAIAGALDNRRDASAGFLGHLPGAVVEIARDRGRAHARLGGNVLDSHLRHSAPRFPIVGGLSHFRHFFKNLACKTL